MKREDLSAWFHLHVRECYGRRSAVVIHSLTGVHFDGCPEYEARMRAFRDEQAHAEETVKP